MPVATDDIPGWVLGRLPDGWFVQPARAECADAEILIIGALDDARAAEAGHAARVQRFRAETREQRTRTAHDTARRVDRSGARTGRERSASASASADRTWPTVCAANSRPPPGLSTIWLAISSWLCSHVSRSAPP